jgi:predicted DNA-binding transcriptional regulator YafY
VQPVDVADDGHVLSLVAHCFLRGEERTFRVDRILDMRLGDGPGPASPRPTP